VKPFLDIAGASGTIFRFRFVPAPTHLPTGAGNFMFLRADLGREGPVCVGSALSLRDAASAWDVAVAQHQAHAIYVRLNVSREVRLREHHDIAERHAPSMVIDELA